MPTPPSSLYSPTNNTTMGDRHNRKRTRHRPHRSDNNGRRAPALYTTYALGPMDMNAAYGTYNNPYISTPTPPNHNLSPFPAPASLHAKTRLVSAGRGSTKSSDRFVRHVQADHSHRYHQESPSTIERRMFGGVDDDSQSAKDLCGPMLDVVLGLFDGIDYDDSLC